MPGACVQCEANARSNEAGGYAQAAAECRAYCERGHKTKAEADLIQRSEQHAQRIVDASVSEGWTADRLRSAVAIAYRAGYGNGAHTAALAAESAAAAVARAVRQ